MEENKSHFRIIKQKCSLCNGLGCNMCYMGEETIVINEDNVIVAM